MVERQVVEGNESVELSPTESIVDYIARLIAVLSSRVSIPSDAQRTPRRHDTGPNSQYRSNQLNCC